MESFRKWEFLIASLLCSRGSVTGGLCNGLLLDGLLLGGLLLLIVLDLLVEVGVVESGAEANVAVIVSGRATATF
jgi:hypothetical protein